MFHIPMKMEQIEYSETSAYIIQTPGNYPKENIIYSEHGESLKSRMCHFGWKGILLPVKYYVSVGYNMSVSTKIRKMVKNQKNV